MLKIVIKFLNSREAVILYPKNSGMTPHGIKKQVFFSPNLPLIKKKSLIS